MKRSTEIEQLGHAFIAALERGDVDFLERATSREPGVVAIGTDPMEYAADFDQIIALMRASTPQAGLAIHVHLTEIRGYEHGDVGWADGVGTFQRNGESVEFRFTFVVLREKGDWRVIQNHASIAVPNEKMFDPLFQRAPAATR